jgi:hypothetical protein
MNEFKPTYELEEPTITFEKWGKTRFDKARYREVFAGADLRTLRNLCETQEELDTLDRFLEFKDRITDRQFDIYVKEQQQEEVSK